MFLLQEAEICPLLMKIAYKLPAEGKIFVLFIENGLKSTPDCRKLPNKLPIEGAEFTTF